MEEIRDIIKGTRHELQRYVEREEQSLPVFNCPLVDYTDRVHTMTHMPVTHVLNSQKRTTLLSDDKLSRLKAEKPYRIDSVAPGTKLALQTL